MKISIGFSPCPNDTFIFDSLVNGGIDTEGLEFNVLMEDVQTLNLWALEGRLDVSKISYGVWPMVTDRYTLLESGSALGRGVGPLLIGNEGNYLSSPDNMAVAIPGRNTTAHLLFSMTYPDAANKLFLRYDEIEDFVFSGKGLGVIIHENRFTYESKGLKKILDLGDYWEKETGTPIPLGGIVARRDLESDVIKKIDRMIRQSIEVSFNRYPELSDFIRSNAQEMEESVMRKHIDLYVNEYSLQLGETGHKAIKKLEQVFSETEKTD